MNPTLDKEQLASVAEETVVALAMTGDDSAFNDLVRRRQTNIRTLMRQLSGDAELADDLAQEAFLQAWRKLNSLKSTKSFGGWLRQIAINIFLQYSRQKILTIQETGVVDTDLSTKTHDAAIKLDLEKALARLKPTERLCIILAYSQRMSHRQICAATDLPLGTVKSHISRGATQLRHLLKDYKGEVP